MAAQLGQMILEREELQARGGSQGGCTLGWVHAGVGARCMGRAGGVGLWVGGWAAERAFTPEREGGLRLGLAPK